jgi:hypothetical protein
MWQEHQRARFQLLRERESHLTDAERAELASLVQALEDAEGAYLNAATERMRQERELIDKQNRSLEELANRRKALAQRLNSVVTEARAERNAIERELASVLAAGQEPTNRE